MGKANIITGFWKEREREGERQRQRDKDRDRDRGNSNSNAKTLIPLKDSRIRSIWTSLTASPCRTNTNKHDNITNKYKHD